MAGRKPVLSKRLTAAEIREAIDGNGILRTIEIALEALQQAEDEIAELQECRVSEGKSARLIVEGKDREISRLRALVEKAFREGFSYGNMRGTPRLTVAEAWERWIRRRERE